MLNTRSSLCGPAQEHLYLISFLRYSDKALPNSSSLTNGTYSTTSFSLPPVSFECISLIIRLSSLMNFFLPSMIHLPYRSNCISHISSELIISSDGLNASSFNNLFRCPSTLLKLTRLLRYILLSWLNSISIKRLLCEGPSLIMLRSSGEKSTTLIIPNKSTAFFIGIPLTAIPFGLLLFKCISIR